MNTMHVSLFCIAYTCCWSCQILYRFVDSSNARTYDLQEFIRVTMFAIFLYSFIHSLFVSDHEDPYKQNTKTDRKTGETGGKNLTIRNYKKWLKYKVTTHQQNSDIIIEITIGATLSQHC